MFRRQVTETPSNGLFGLPSLKNKNTLIMCPKENLDVNRDWLNLSNKTTSQRYGSRSRSRSRSRNSRNQRSPIGSTPLREISPGSYINIATPVYHKNNKRDVSLLLSGSEMDKSRASLSDFMDQKFPPKPPKSDIDRRTRSRSNSNNRRECYQRFFGEYPKLKKYSKLITKLHMPKNYKGFRPKIWQYGINFFLTNYHLRQATICNRVNPGSPHHCLQKARQEFELAVFQKPVRFQPLHH